MGIVGRSLGAFLFAIGLVRVVGRKSMAQFNYLDFLTANLAGNMMGYYAAGEDKGPKLLLAPVTIIASTLLTEFVAVKNKTVRTVLEGKPKVIIRNGKVLEEALKTSLYNINELLLALRQNGIFDISEIEFAILETNGKISVLRKADRSPVNRSDLGLATKPASLSAVLISDGDVLEENLQQNKLTHAWLDQQLAKQKVMDKNTVFLAVLCSDGSLYVDLKHDQLTNPVKN